MQKRSVECESYSHTCQPWQHPVPLPLPSLPESQASTLQEPLGQPEQEAAGIVTSLRALIAGGSHGTWESRGEDKYTVKDIRELGFPEEAWLIRPSLAPKANHRFFLGLHRTCPS